MAGGEQSSEYEIDPEVEKRWQLSRRTDLANAFGVMLNVPAHGQDDAGKWQYGRTPTAGMAHGDFADAFQTEMQSLITLHGSFLVSEGLLSAEQVEALAGHPYSVGPAAQEWPKYFFEFYRDVRPILSDGASVLGWAYFFKDLVRGIQLWSSNKQQEVYESMAGQDYSPGDWSEVSVTPVLTRPALIALCYADVTKRYGIGEDVTIDTFPRSYTDYATPDHPGGSETYLVRIKAGKRRFFYLVDSNGRASEHYLTTGADLTLLPLPNLLGDDDLHQPRQPQPSHRIRIRAAQAKPR